MTTEQNPAGRVWLVTGASSGFGRAITLAALAAGDTVVAAVRTPASLAELAAAHQERLDVVALDVTDATRIPAVVDEVAGRHGRIDVLVNNAGRGHVGAVEETTDAELRDLMELHFFGAATLTRAVLPHMRERRSGAVVQVTSMGGRMSFGGVGAYSATKFALEGLSEALADEVAPFGVKVLIVEPGAFHTGFTRSGALRASAAIPAYDEVVGPVRTVLTGADGVPPGDPAKAAAAILAALDADETPLRLPLGGDAVEAITGRLRDNLAEIGVWETTARGTGYEKERV